MKKLITIKDKWFFATMMVACIIYCFSLRWQLLDNSPPRWDESGYLLQATVYCQKLMNHGGWSFIYEVFNYDRGRGMLLTLLVQPFFVLLGPSLDVAMAAVDIFWFLLAWSIHGLTKYIPGRSYDSRSGFFAFVLFALNPMTIYLSNLYLVEFVLVAFVTSSHYALIRYHGSGCKKWIWLLGLFVGLGMLTKVTFVVFVIPVIMYGVWGARNNITQILKDYVLAIVIVLIVAGPYYLYNFKHIIASTAFLSSAQLANLYNFGPVFNINTILAYWKGIFYNPSMIIAIVLSIAYFVNLFITESKALPYMSRIGIYSCLLWIIVPFVICTFGTIKDPRYVFPALVPFIIFSAKVISDLLENKFGIVGVFLSLLIPVNLYLATNKLISPKMSNALKMNYSDMPDERDWKVKNIVLKLDRILNERGVKKKIIMLGGNRYYHLNLLRYYSIIDNIDMSYEIIPYFSNFNIKTAEDSLTVIKSIDHGGILYKTGPYYPEFSSKHCGKIIDSLMTNPNYEHVDLGIMQPDGSEFYLFVNTI